MLKIIDTNTQTIKTLSTILAFCLVNHSCGFRGFSQPYETTIQLVDMDNKPIKGIKVNIKHFIGFGGSFNNSISDMRSSSMTNLNGNTTFNYSLNISDSSSDGASFAADDDTKWKLVNDVSHTVNTSSQKKTIKQVLKIQMDTLKDVKVRLQKTSLTPLLLSLNASITNNENPVINNVLTAATHTTRLYDNSWLFGWSKKKVGVFDSLYTCKLYSKANCYLYASTYKDSIYPNGTTYDERVEVKVHYSNDTNRDSIIHLILQK